MSPSSTSRSSAASSSSSHSASIDGRVTRWIFAWPVSGDRLAVRPQLLVELLAGPRADELDANVALGLLARQLDHVAREIDDAHRLAHVEHEDLAAAADRARLDDQRHGLGNRHEVAGHLGMRDGQRAAALDLTAEDRDDAPRRAEHVAEAHRHEARRRCPAGGRTPRRSTRRAPSTGPSLSSG